MPWSVCHVIHGVHGISVGAGEMCSCVSYICYTHLRRPRMISSLPIYCLLFSYHSYYLLFLQHMSSTTPSFVALSSLSLPPLSLFLLSPLPWVIFLHLSLKSRCPGLCSQLFFFSLSVRLYSLCCCFNHFYAEILHLWVQCLSTACIYNCLLDISTWKTWILGMWCLMCSKWSKFSVSLSRENIHPVLLYT